MARNVKIKSKTLAPAKPAQLLERNRLQGKTGSSSGTAGRERSGAGVKADRSHTAGEQKNWQNGTDGNQELQLNEGDTKGVDTDSFRRSGAA